MLNDFRVNSLKLLAISASVLVPEVIGIWLCIKSKQAKKKLAS